MNFYLVCPLGLMTAIAWKCLLVTVIVYLKNLSHLLTIMSFQTSMTVEHTIRYFE